MRDESYLLPDKESLHCTICGRIQPCTRDELEKYIFDDSQWPHCCGARMAVDFPKSDDEGRGE